MTDFYYKYRGLFEEDEMSKNYALQFLVAGRGKHPDCASPEPSPPLHVPVARHSPVLSFPSPPAPLKNNRSYQQPEQRRPAPAINVLRREPPPRVAPLRAETLNALLNYQQQQRQLPELPRRLEPEEPRQALRNVYKNSLISSVPRVQSPAKESPYRFENPPPEPKRTEMIHSSPFESPPRMEQGTALKDSYRPEGLVSHVLTSEEVFPTPPKRVDVFPRQRENPAE